MKKEVSAFLNNYQKFYPFRLLITFDTINMTWLSSLLLPLTWYIKSLWYQLRLFNFLIFLLKRYWNKKSLEGNVLLCWPFSLDFIIECINSKLLSRKLLDIAFYSINRSITIIENNFMSILGLTCFQWCYKLWIPKFWWSNQSTSNFRS